MGEGLESEENRETFTKMFGGDKKKASDFVKNLLDSGFFEGRTWYNDEEDKTYDLDVNEFVAQDEEGYYYMDLSGLQFANIDLANEILQMIPFKDQMEANDSTFAHIGDIDLSQVSKMYLVSKEEEYEFTNKDDLIKKYNELTNNSEEKQ